MSDDPASAKPPRRTALVQRMAALVDSYGRVAIVTYLAFSLLAILGFSIAIAVGTQPSSATGVLGVLGAGWVAAKATLPIRIVITLAITPLIALIIGRFRRGAGAP